MHRVASGLTGVLLLAIGFIACTDDSTSSPAPSVDGGSFDGASNGDGGPPVSTDGGGPAPDGATPQRPNGRYLRFAHLAEARKDDKIDFCLKPDGSGDFTTPVHAPLGAAGLGYGEVGRFMPMEPGEYDWVATSSGDCADVIDNGTLTIPSAAIGPWGFATLAFTLTSTGVIALEAGDYEMLRDATQDRITVVDGTGPRDPNAVLAVDFVGSTTVSLNVPNNTRSASALVPAGESGKITVGLDGNPETPIKTVAGGHAMVVVYGAGQMRVCDYDAPIPTTGALSPCTDRK